jgi:hypothetical protein
MRSMRVATLIALAAVIFAVPCMADDYTFTATVQVAYANGQYSSPTPTPCTGISAAILYVVKPGGVPIPIECGAAMACQCWQATLGATVQVSGAIVGAVTFNPPTTAILHLHTLTTLTPQ